MRTKTITLAVGLALAGAAQAAEITIYKQPNFAGGDQTFSRDMTSLEGTGVFDQSKSIVVRSGQWQACSQPNFGGDCLVLGRGQYSTLPQQLNGRIESVREVSRVADAEERYARWRWRDGRWSERQNWVKRDDRDDRDWNDHAYRRDDNDRGRYASRRGGSPVVLWADGNATYFDRDMSSLERTPYGAGAERMVIRDGTWEVCVQPGYRGMCRTFEPGVYDRLGRFGTQIGSLRRVG